MNKGFIIPFDMTSSLDRLDGAARTAVLGAVYAKVRGLADYALPKKFAYLSFLVDGIADESAELCANRPLTSTERSRRCRARQAHATDMQRNATDMQRNATDATHIERKIDSKRESETRTREDPEETNPASPRDGEAESEKNFTPRVPGAGNAFGDMPQLVREAARKLRIPADFTDYFIQEMTALDWRTMNGDGRAFAVEPSNVGSILRNWWNQEKRKQQGATPPPPLPVTGAGRVEIPVFTSNTPIT